eukprot:45824-Chlamydomonas_euryale.AAC.1
MFISQRYGSLAAGLPKFMLDSWNAISVVANTTLMIMSVVLTVNWFLGLTDASTNPAGWIHVTLSTIAVLVWIRALSFVIPIYPRLGPLLATMTKMVHEVGLRDPEGGGREVGGGGGMRVTKMAHEVGLRDPEGGGKKVGGVGGRE